MRDAKAVLERGHIASIFRLLVADKIALAAWLVLLLFFLLAALGPHIAPHDPVESYYKEDGSVMRLEPPSRKFLLGTTNVGQDVLSQTIVGARVPIEVGLVSAFFVVLIGTNVGLLAGYFGRSIDAILMRARTRRSWHAGSESSMHSTRPASLGADPLNV